MTRTSAGSLRHMEIEHDTVNDIVGLLRVYSADVLDGIEADNRAIAERAATA